MEKKGIKIAAQNRKAYHDYFVEDRLEAGIELKGTEVKSIRAGTLNLKDSYCVVKNGEAMVYSMHLALRQGQHLQPRSRPPQEAAAAQA